MTIAEEIAADIASIEAEIPQVVTWNGSDYPCVSGSSSLGRQLGVGGYLPQSGLVVFIRAALFAGTIPTAKQTLVKDGKTWRIDEVIVPQGTPVVRLSCIDPLKGI